MALDRLTQITSSGISSDSIINVSAVVGVVTATTLGVTGNVTTNLNVTGVVTATSFTGDISSSGVSTFSRLQVGASVNISSGVVTATTFSGNLTGNVTGNATGLSGTPSITVATINASNATFSGNVSVAGTVTYEDVTNVDSVGLITARSGIRVNDGGVVLIGSGTSTGTASQPLQVTGGAYVSGNLGIGTNNPGAKLHLIGNQYLQGGNYFTDTTSGYFWAGNGSFAGGIYGSNSGNVTTIISPQTINLLTSSTQRASINSSGQLFIGTTNQSPSSTSNTIGIFNGTILAGNTSGLTTSTSGGNDTAIVSGGDIEILRDGVSGTQRHGRIRATGDSLGGPYSSGIAFDYYYYNGSAYVYNEGMRISSAGNIGIGTNSSFAKTHIEINAVAGAGSGSAAALWLRNSNQTSNNSATIFAGNNSSQASAAINFIHQNYSTNAGAITFDTRTDSSTYAERMRIDASGRITAPYQPSFSVWYSGSQSIPHNTPTKVQFNVEVFDVGGNFDSSTNYRFTAPVAGKYLFMGHLYIYNTYQVEVYIYKNGSQYKRFSGPLGSGGNDNPNGMDFLDIIDLAVNDYVEIYGYQSRTGDTASQLIYGGPIKETSFVGYLIG